MARRSKTDELLDFEIAFYEKLLRAYPDFVDALMPLGHAYTRRRLHDKALTVDLRLTQLRVQDPLSWYNLACSYSLLSRVEEGLEALRRAIGLGYADFAYLQQDPDLANVRRSQHFREFITAFPGLLAKPAQTNPQA